MHRVRAFTLLSQLKQNGTETSQVLCMPMSCLTCHQVDIHMVCQVGCFAPYLQYSVRVSLASFSCKPAFCIVRSVFPDRSLMNHIKNMRLYLNLI